MTEIKYTYDKKTREIHLTVKGHSGGGEAGHDLVCAAVSILTYTAAHVVATLHRHGDIDGEPVIKLTEGDAEIFCKAKDDYIFGEMLTMLFAITTGYVLLQGNCPENVRFLGNE